MATGKASAAQLQALPSFLCGRALCLSAIANGSYNLRLQSALLYERHRAMRRADLPLIALLKSPDQRLTPVQMQKTLFLLTENIADALGGKLYTFTPYNYGPFDATIYRDLEDAIESGYVETIPTKKGWDEYRLTAFGRTVAQQAIHEMDEESVAYVSRVASWARTVSFRDLLTAIYHEYPYYASRSVFRG